MSTTNATSDRPKQVFISYAQADNDAARRIATRLKSAGVRVWFDEWSLSVGDSIVEKIESELRAADVLLVLLSPASVESRWVRKELNAALSSELRSRAVTVIPALIADCELPLLLADRQYVDLRSNFEAGVGRLIEQLNIIPEIDFSTLDGREFEQLVADLLVELGFKLEKAQLSRDSGFDFAADLVVEDPFGAMKRELWLVEVKRYKSERVNLQSLRQMFGYMVTIPGVHKGLVVINSQLTSVATDYLSEMSETSGRELRVIDGAELRGLLLRHPGVVSRYFGKA